MSTIENPAAAAAETRSPARAHLADIISLREEARRIDTGRSTPQSSVALHSTAVAAQEAALAVIEDETSHLVAEGLAAVDGIRGVTARMNGLRAFAEARTASADVYGRIVGLLDSAFASMRVECRLADSAPEAAAWSRHVVDLLMDADATLAVSDGEV